MKIFPSRSKDKKDKSLELFHGEAATSSAETVGCAFQSPSLIAAGANASSVALLSTITNIILAALLIKVPSLVEGKTPLKKTVIVLGTISAITWLPIIFALLFIKNISPLLLVGLWTINVVPSILILPLRDNWLANIIPSDKMGRYLGLRAAISGIFYLISFYVMGYSLDVSSSDISRGYAFILSIAFVASASNVLVYIFARPPATMPESPTKNKISFSGFIKGAKKERLGTFIIFVTLFTFAVYLNGPLFAVFILSELKFSYMTYTLIISCEYIARIISLTFWGKQVDKLGSLQILGKVSHLIPFVPILWLFSGNFFYLCLAQLFSGTIWAAFDLCCQTFIYKSTKPEQKLRYMVYYRSLITLAAALGTLTSALLLTNMFRIFGSQILGMLLLSGILRMVIVRIMIPRLKPGAIPDVIAQEEMVRQSAKSNSGREALYYHPEEWSRLAKPMAVFGTIVNQAANKVASRPSGLYYNPQKWSSYTNQSLKRDHVAAQFTDSRVPKSGLYYDKPIQTNHVKKTHEQSYPDIKQVREGILNNILAQPKLPDQPIVVMSKLANNTKTTRNGLFYNTQNWGDYLKQSLVLNATTIRTNNEGQTNRQAILYHPEIWSYFNNQSVLSRNTMVKVGSSRQALLYHPEEWEKIYNPAIVRIGRKSAIGTVLHKQRQINYFNRETPPVSYQSPVRQAMPIKRIKMVPLPA